MNRKKKQVPPQATPWTLPTLAVFVLLGILGGQAVAGIVPPAVQSELSDYLTNFIHLPPGHISAGETARNTLILYIRYPLLAFFTGFSFIGVILLPCLAFLFGLGLSFSTGCFTAAFGTKGLLLSCASFGLRTLVTLPCFLLAAAPAWETAFRLFALSFGRGRRPTISIYKKAMWFRFGAILGILLAGVCADLVLTPRLLQLVLT